MRIYDVYGQQLVEVPGDTLRGAELEGVGLRRASLENADMHHANLRNADMQNVWGQQADLRGADMRNVHGRWANLRGADLRGADMEMIDLRDADIVGANLRGVNLRGADMERADLREVQLWMADLGGARINWFSHETIAEILRRAAGEDVGRRMLAGLVAISRNWCWKQFADAAAQIDPEVIEWGMEELRAYDTPQNSAPVEFQSILDVVAVEALEASEV